MRSVPQQNLAVPQKGSPGARYKMVDATKTRYSGHRFAANVTG